MIPRGLYFRTPLEPLLVMACKAWSIGTSKCRQMIQTLNNICRIRKLHEKVARPEKIKVGQVYFTKSPSP